jgi:hypothetical protein
MSILNDCCSDCPPPPTHCHNARSRILQTILEDAIKCAITNRDPTITQIDGLHFDTGRSLKYMLEAIKELRSNEGAYWCATPVERCDLNVPDDCADWRAIARAQAGACLCR